MDYKQRFYMRQVMELGEVDEDGLYVIARGDRTVMIHGNMVTRNSVFAPVHDSLNMGTPVETIDWEQTYQWLTRRSGISDIHLELIEGCISHCFNRPYSEIFLNDGADRLSNFLRNYIPYNSNFDRSLDMRLAFTVCETSGTIAYQPKPEIVDAIESNLRLDVREEYITWYSRILLAESSIQARLREGLDGFIGSRRTVDTGNIKRILENNLKSLFPTVEDCEVTVDPEGHAEIAFTYAAQSLRHIRPNETFTIEI